MSETTLVVGGYGSVGRTVARELVAAADHDRVVIAGRDGGKAKAFARELGDVASGVAFDVADTTAYDDVLDGVDHAVVCLDQNGTAFVEACMDRGVDYVDVTASDEFFRQVEALDERARDGGSRVLLSVGLAPGVTNLLAVRAADKLSDVAAIRIGVLLGLGEAFGPAASRWTLERIGRPFTVVTAEGRRSVRGFTDPATMEFPRYGRRTAYAFDFADQHALTRTLDVPTRARFCFDSRTISTALYGSARLGGYRPFVDVVGIDRLVELVEAFPGGGDGFAVTVEVDGDRDGTPLTLAAALDGREQSQVTGIVAAAVTAAVRHDDIPSGVHHVHEVLEPDAVLDVLRDRGYRVTTSERVHGTDESVTPVP